RFHKGVGLVQIAAHRQSNNREQRSNDERYSPAPSLQLIGGQKDLLQQKEDEDGAKLAADKRDVLEAGVKAAMLFVGDFRKIPGPGAVLTTKTQALNNARQPQH